MDQKPITGFEQEMWRLYEEPKKRCGYNATYFVKMIQEHGALEAAHRLAGNPKYSEGLTRLWECKALDLSVEALVLQDPWNKLFSPDVLSIARKKLRDLRYSEPGLGL
jgi:hypothetical protein